MKTAAPQAPDSTHPAANTGAKTLARSAKSAHTMAFAAVLAKTVAATAAASGRATGRLAAAGSPVRSARTASATAKASRGDAARTGRQRRTGEAPSAARLAVEQHAIGRTAAAQLPPTAAAPAAGVRAPRPAPAGRRIEPRVQVVDLRRMPAAADAPEAARSGRKAPSGKVDGELAGEKPFAERLAAAGGEAKAATPARATPLERIREMTGSDLARTVGLVVRDGGGEIRLTLNPPSLGSVRIRLSLEDGTVNGRIVVDTSEARQAFEASLDGLTRALHAEGFETGSLQVSVSGGNADDSRQAAGLLGDTIAAARLRAEDEVRLDRAVPAVGWNGGGDGLVNVFA